MLQTEINICEIAFGMIHDRTYKKFPKIPYNQFQLLVTRISIESYPPSFLNACNLNIENHSWKVIELNVWDSCKGNSISVQNMLVWLSKMILA
jgi:hypothetical protein